MLLGRNAAEFPIWACFSEETGRISRFSPVAKKKHVRIPDLGVFLGRNLGRIPDLGVLLERNAAFFPI